VANITIAPTAAIGLRRVTVTTGTESVTHTTDVFLVAANAPAIPTLTSASPAAVQRGSTTDVALTGMDTTFVDGTSRAAASGVGVDVLATDKLGHLALSREGCRRRDELVLGLCHARGLPVAVGMGGGYSARIADIVEAHANTFRVAAGLWG